ncbi:MAG: triose-phosphate isomerase [Spirochaetales bacterium]|nr:triose-phosphate isomerase [Spirochaetales bacterium]
MRKPFIAGNWKMNKTPSEAKVLAADLVNQLKDSTNKLLVAPSFTCLATVAEVVKGSNIMLGAQNMATVEQGAHTGETSVLMLKDLGVEAVILGHSERRHIYGETDAMINQKVKLAIAHGLEVLLCVGETIDEREAGKAVDVVNTQLEEGLKDVAEADLKFVTIAYEPVWAIGTGKTATPQDAQDIHLAARSKVADLYSKDAADKICIQYGGSVNASNVKELMGQPDIDGGLIGGASLTPDAFLPIANFNK